jgi:curved DNA-binding protein CbpA
MTMTLKNYYEILGVREDALDEEIRDRWIELVKDCHPDLEGEDPVDERIKEINEAYQVLKQPTTRFEYDLQREYERKMERTSRRRKLTIPAVGFVILLAIAGWIYLENTEVPMQVSSGPNVVPGEGRSLPIVRQLESESKTEANHEVPLSLASALPLPESRSGEAEVEVPEKKVTGKQEALVANDPMTNKPQKAPRTKKPEVKTSKVAAPKVVSTKAEKPKSGEQPRTQGEAKPLDLLLPKPVLAQATRVERKQDEREAKPANYAKPSLLASKEEVTTFFTNYVNAYNHKNHGALITLFSSKAIQNNSERYDEIKRSFARFFVQSKEIRYHLEDLKFEIYENAVEATAAYEIAQVVRRWGENKTWKGNIRWHLIKENGALKVLSLDYKNNTSH